ncbi:MAG: MEKHLA domain-containing protein [Nitrospira sp. CG24D]|nr:MAG: MEKHLA domain-containing protein [Nitrospira sp. CG24D]
MLPDDVRHRFMVTWSQLLLDSFRHWTGRDLLIRTGTPDAQAQALFAAPFVVVSHGAEADPLLNYGNQQALDLWELSWAQLTSTPSRLTAEPMNRDERARMLAVAEKQGYYSGYRGIRISSTGKRFLVEDATVWNVVDGQGIRVGQAATFARWTMVK